MKFLNRLFCFIGLSLLAISGMASAQPDVRILPLGDSITLGCCSGSGAQGGYRNKLYTSLTNAGYTVDFLGTQTDTLNPGLPDTDHQGHSSFTINDIRAGLSNWLAAYAAPDVVLLHIGTNDFTDGLSSVVDVQNRLRNLVEELHVLRPHARVIVSSLLPRSDIPGASDAVNSYNSSLPQFVAGLAAAGHPVHYLDMHSTFLLEDLNDGLHPNPVGYTKMADLLFPAVTSIISPNGGSHPPAIAGVNAADSLTSVSIEFNKPITDSSAVAENFAINGGVTVSNAVLDSSKRVVTLTTSAQTAGAPYTVSVSGVRDRTAQQKLISSGAARTFTARAFVDSSFELNNASWSISGNAAISSNFGAREGINSLVFNSSNSSPDGVVTQAATTVPGQVYEFSFDFGVFGAASDQELEIKVIGSDPLNPLVSQTRSKTGPGSGPASWETVTYQFLADSATTLLSFRDLSLTSTNVDLLVDYVRLKVKVTPTLSVASSPTTGASIAVSPNDLSLNGAGTTDFSRVYHENTLVTLTAPSSANLINFEMWQRDGVSYGSAPTVVVPMDASHTMTAIYATPRNGSFEDGIPDVNGVISQIPNWTGSGAFFGFVGDSNYVPTAGNRLVVFNGIGAAPSGVISQSFQTVIGQSYTLRFKMGVIFGAVVQQLQVGVVGATSLVSAVHSKTHTSSGAAQWEELSHVFVADSTSSTVTFSDVSASTAGVDLLLDEVTIVPSPGNTAPVAVNDSYTTSIDQALVISSPGVLANDTDAESNSLSSIKEVNSLPVNGTVVLNSDGGFTYTPDSGYTGSDSFTYTAWDGSLASNVATVSISVSGSSTQVLSNGGFELGSPNQDGFIYSIPSWSTTGNVVFAYEESSPYLSQAGGRLLVFNDGGGTGNGTISQTFPTVAGQTYQLEFYMRANGPSQQAAQVLIEGSAPIFTGSFTTNSQSWEVKSQSFVATGTSTTLSFSDVSVDASGSDLLIDSVSVTGAAGVRSLNVTSTVASGVLVTVAPPDDGSLADGTTSFFRSYPNGTSVTLTAPATSGGLQFVKWQKNGSDLSAGLVASVEMDGNHTLNAVYAAPNVAPVAVDDSYSATTGIPLVIAAPGVLANDSDVDSGLITAIKVVNVLPQNGTLSLNSDGGFSYTSNNGFVGSDSFTYTANDGTLDSDPATVVISVDAPGTSQLLVNRDFEDGIPDGGAIRPVPSWNSSGPVVFGYVGDSTYFANSGSRLLVFNDGTSTASGTISQTFPTISGQAYQLEFYLKAVGTTQTVRVDVDGAGSIFSGNFSAEAAAWEPKSHLFIANSNSTTLSFTDVSAISVGSDLLLDSVSVTGAAGARSLNVTSTVASPVNVALAPADLGSLGDGATPFARSYPDGTSVTLTAPATSGGSSFVKWQKNGSDLPPGLVATVTMDGNHTMNAVYAAANVAPVAVNDSYSTTTGVPLVIGAPGVLANDSDVESNSLTAVPVINGQPSNGTLSLDVNGGFTYAPNNGFTGSDSFTYTANDGVLNSNPATVTISVGAASTIQLLGNPDFEIGTAVAGVISPIPFWTSSGPAFGYVGVGPYAPNSGTRLLVFNNGEAVGSGSVSQSFATVIGQSYLVEFYQRSIGDPQTVRVDIVGAAPIYSGNRSAGSAAWELKSQSFVATSVTTTLTLTDVSTGSDVSDLLLDSISVTGPGSRTLNITSSGVDAVNVAISPQDINFQGGGATPLTRSYSDGVTVTLTAPATSGGFAFVKWQRNGIDLPPGLVASIVVSANETLNAVYGGNVAPVAQNDNYTAEAGVPLVIAAPGVLGNDSDGDSLSLTAIKEVNSLPAHGTLELSSNGGFTYTPVNGFTGSDSFTYSANDGALNSNVATVSITVTQPAVQLLSNGSFEDGTTPDGHGIVSAVTAWTRSGSQVGFVGTDSYLPTDGQRMILFNPGNTTVQDGVISQSFDTTPGQAYLLRYNTTALGNGVQKLGVTVEGSGILFAGDSGDLQGMGFGVPTWVERSHYFVANTAATVLTLRDLSTTGTMVDLLLDNVRVTASTARGLVVTSTGAGALGVTVTPSDLNLTGNGVTPFSRSFPQGTSVTLSAPATSGGLDFVKWQRDNIDFPGGRTITVAMDGNYTFNAVYIGNTAPLAANNNYSTPEGTQLVVSSPGVLGNDTDAESNLLTAVLVDAPATGTFNFNPNGSFSYTPVSGFNGTVSFAYRASDGFLTSNLATVFITVGSAPPVVILNPSFELGTPDGSGVIAPIPSWTRSGPVVFAFVGNAPYLPDTGKGNNILVFNNGNAVASGSISQQFATTPGQAYLLEFDMGVVGVPSQKVRVQLTGAGSLVSTDLVKMGASNGMATWQSKGVQFIANSALTTLTFTDVSDTAAGVDLMLDDVRVSVIGGNTAPVAVADSFSTVQQVPLTVLAPGVLANDSDPQADPISAILVSGPANGVLEGAGLGADGGFVYTPNPSFSGVDTFTYKVTDALLDSETVTVSITVTPGLPNLLNNGGFEQGSPSNFGPLTGWSQSGIFPNPVAPFGYVPDSGYPANTSDGVRLLVMNGAGGSFGGLVSQAFSTTVGQAYALDLNVGVFSGGVVGKKQALQVTVAGHTTRLSTLVVETSTAGTATLNPKSFTFVADSASTTITLLDASASQSPNDASDLLVDLVRVSTIDIVRSLNVTTSAAGIDVGIAPPDLAGDAAGVSAFTRSYADGSVVGLTAPLFVGANAFQKWQLDGIDITPFNRTATVTMDSDKNLNAVYVVDNNPRATPDTYTTDEDQPLIISAPGLLANDFNPNSEALTAVLDDAPSVGQGTVTLSSNGSFVFVPAANFSGKASFTYHISFGTSSSVPVPVSIIVNPVNDTSTALPQSVVTNEDTPIGIILSGNDADGTPITYSVVNQPTKGILTGSAPNLTYTPNLNAHGLDSFTFTASDGTGVSVPATVSIDITPVNDVPVVTARTFSMAGGTTQAILFTGTDPDNDPLTFAVAGGPANGTVTGNSPNFTYIPNPAFTGLDSFTYVANDGVSNSVPATVSISVSEILINGSFENALSGNWVVTGLGFDLTTSNFPTNGSRLARFNSGNVSPNASISQMIPTRPGFRYRVQFQLGATGGINLAQRMTVSAIGSSSVLNTQLTVLAPGGPGSNWVPQSLVFTANSAVTELRFADTSVVPSHGVDLLLDDVRVVPEAARILRVDSTPNSNIPVTTSAPADLVSNAVSGILNTQFNRYYLLDSSPAITLAVPAVVGSASFQKWLRNGADFAGNTELSTNVTLNVDTTMTAVYLRNLAPVTLADGYSSHEDTALVVPAATGVLANDSDPESAALSAMVVTGPTKGQLTLESDGGFTYTPNLNASGPDAFTYRASDGVGQSVVTTVNLMVSPVNDPPSFSLDPLIGPDATEEVSYIASVNASASDVESGLVSYSKVSGPAWLIVAPNGVLLGTPMNVDVGLNSFVIRATDGDGGSSDASLQITVINVNDPPVFVSDPVVGADAIQNLNYSGSLASRVVDVDAGDALIYEKVSGPSWLAVGADGTLSGVPGNSDVGMNSFVVRVRDGSDLSDEAALNIVVVNINDAPVFAIDPLNLSDATEDSPYIASVSGSAIDVDSGDSVTYSKISGPSWVQVASDGTVSGTPLNEHVGLNSLVLGATDSSAALTQATVRIMVLNVDDAPLFTADPMVAGDATEDENYSGSLGSFVNEIDPGDTLTFSKISGPSWLEVASDGSLTGNPTNSDVGLNLFVVSVTDGNSSLISAGLSILVINSNDTPVFALDPMTLGNATEDLEYSGTISGSASDVDAGDSITYSKISGPGWLQVASDGSLSGTPANENVGTNVFVVGATDGSSAIGQATLNITVLNVNDAPAFASDPTVVANATEDANFTASLVGSAVDVDAGAVLVYSDLSGPAWLSLGSNGVLSGTPSNSDVGLNTFTVRVTDGLSDPVQATLQITVLNVNDAPEFTVDPIPGNNATEDEGYLANLAALVTDQDGGETLTFVKVSGPAWLTVAANGAVSGTPLNEDVGLNEFVVRVTDGASASDEAALNITVLNVNDAPAFASDPTVVANATEDATYTESLVGSAVDVDAGAVLVYSDLSGPTWLSLGSNGVLSGTPSNSDVGLNEFTVRVTDGLSDPVQATLQITVLNVNDAPEFTVDPIQGNNATEDSPYTASLANAASDMDPGATLSYAKVSGPAWLTVGTSGDLSGTPLNTNVGLNVFTVSVTDGLSTPVLAILNVTVINVNDAPAFTVDPMDGIDATEDLAYSGTLAGSATDVDQEATLTYAKVSGPSWLTVGSTGQLSGTPANEDVGVNVFTVSVSDSLSIPVVATLRITVVNVNDPPAFTANPIAGANASEDSPYSASLAGAATDLDAGATLAYAKVSGPSWLTVASDGALSGTPVNANVGPNIFTVSVTDGLSTPVLATLNITVVNVNDAPTFTVNPIEGGSVIGGNLYNGSLVGSASDIDSGDSLSYSKISGPSWLVVSNGGALSGTPAGTNVGLNSFVIQVADAANATATATLNITVIAANNVPVANSQSITLDEDTSVNIVLTGTDADSSENLLLSSISLPANGFLSGSPPNLTYTPKPNYSGPDSFTFTMTDGQATSSPATISITVRPVVDDNFANWLAGFGMIGNPGEDHDRDTINNAVEFVIGGNPLNRSDVSLLPTVTVVRADPDQNTSLDDYLLFSYRRTAQAHADEKTTIQVQWNSALTGNWSNASTTPGVVTLITPINPSLDTVNVYIPRSFGQNGRLFARLSVLIDVPAANVPPVAQAQSITLNENNSLPIILAATDVNSQPLTYRITTPPTKGLLTGVAPNLTYTPAPNTSGSDSFTFVANDGISDSAPATVSVTIQPLHQFNQWMSTFGLAAAPNLDSDNDSISNAIEYVIGGNPANMADSSLLPTISLVSADPDNNSTNESYLLFTYRRTDLAKNDPRTTIRCEWGTSLVGAWNHAIGTAGVVTIEEPNALGANFGLVRVFIPRTYAVNGRLFARLNVTIASP